MNKVVAVVSPSPEPPVSSNCEVTVEGNTIILTDPTSRPNKFTQRGSFDEIVYDHQSLVDQVPATGSFRIVTLFGDRTRIPTEKICEIATAISVKRFPGNGQVLPVSIGLLDDCSVEVFHSLTEEETGELVDTYDVAELIDVIECGLQKLGKMKEAVLVLHIGATDFFEWVLVPKADTYCTVPSPFGLISSHRLIFALRSPAHVTPETSQSAVFKLVSDSFTGVPTIWAMCIGTDVAFQSNAAMLNTAGPLMNHCHDRVAVEHVSDAVVSPAAPAGEEVVAAAETGSEGAAAPTEAATDQAAATEAATGEAAPTEVATDQAAPTEAPADQAAATEAPADEVVAPTEAATDEVAATETATDEVAEAPATPVSPAVDQVSKGSEGSHTSS